MCCSYRWHYILWSPGAELTACERWHGVVMVAKAPYEWGRYFAKESFVLITARWLAVRLRETTGSLS